MKLLSVACNYLDHPENQLRGCWNDSDSVLELAKKKGCDHYVVMKDTPENRNTELYPTADNIVIQIQKFVSSLKSGELGIFHYSGHGGSLPDKNGDEKDGKDECIYPCDLEEILDDDLRLLLVDCLPDGAKLRVIMDCCHSGSSMDLSYRYVNLAKIEREASLSNKDVICISGCKDAQTSADAFIDNKSQGALTANIVKLVNSKHANWKWRDFIAVLDTKLKEDGYSQIPQLSFCRKKACSELFDLF